MGLSCNLVRKTARDESARRHALQSLPPCGSASAPATGSLVMTCSKNRPKPGREFVKFGLVGAVGTACHYATLIGLVELLGMNPAIATTAGFAVGMVVNYRLNYSYTFHSDAAHLVAAPKFFSIGIVTGALNGLLLHVGANVAQLNYLAVQIVATLGLFIANFVLNSLWTFRGRRGS